MHKDKALSHIKQQLSSEEELIDFCVATKSFKIWLFALIGPLAVFSMKSYFLAITNKGLHFHALDFLGRFSQHDFFHYREIDNLKIGSGMMQIPMKFTFASGRKLKIKAQKTGVDSVAKIHENTLTFLKQFFPQDI